MLPEAGRIMVEYFPVTTRRAPSASPGAARDYFLTAGFFLSCLGFMLFLSFFCELLPLPIFASPVAGVSGRHFDYRNVLSIGKKLVPR